MHTARFTQKKADAAVMPEARVPTAAERERTGLGKYFLEIIRGLLWGGILPRDTTIENVLKPRSGTITRIAVPRQELPWSV